MAATLTVLGLSVGFRPASFVFGEGASPVALFRSTAARFSLAGGTAIEPGREVAEESAAEPRGFEQPTATAPMSSAICNFVRLCIAAFRPVPDGLRLFGVTPR